MSPHQRRAYEQYRERFVVGFEPGRTWDPRRGRPVVVEVGFGMGYALAELADRYRDHDFVGIEVHRPGVGKLMSELDRRGLTNVRIIEHDAVEVLMEMLADGVTDGLHLFFPDPWPKKRHHKRRMVQGGFPDMVGRVLRPDGYLYLVTDWEHYAHQMRHVMGSSPLFALSGPVNDAGFSVPPGWRVPTAFERKGRAAGHRIHELFYRRARATIP